jgi:tetratricopeptide (TPR) repeat protein
LNQKTFYKLIIEFNLDPQKSKSYAQDKRLTFNEKKTLEAFFLIRNNENIQAMNLLKELTPSPLHFVEAQRLFLLGLSLNNQSHFVEAESYLLKSLSILKELETPFSLFMCYFNLSFVYCNLARANEMKKAMDAMEFIEQVAVFQKARYLRVCFSYYSLVDDEKNALKVLKDLKPMMPEMPESDCIAQLVTEFIYYCKREEFSKCEKVLNEMKNYRKFHLTENFTFMKKLLNHLTKDERIYISENSSHSVPLLNLQLRVIQALEETDLEKADYNWAKLRQMMPNDYQDNFQFVGKKCLFSLCLDKHLSKTRKIQPIKKNESVNLINSLYTLLKNSPIPLSKSYIYEHLWSETPSEKEDFNKLERLVSRMRTEKGIKVISRKNTYAIKIESKKKQVS